MPLLTKWAPACQEELMKKGNMHFLQWRMPWVLVEVPLVGSLAPLASGRSDWLAWEQGELLQVEVYITLPLSLAFTSP